MQRPDYPIETPRLHLRPIDPAADVDAVHAYQSQEEVCRYIPYSPRTKTEVAERLASGTYRSTVDGPGQALVLAVVMRASGELIGDVMLAWTSAEHRSGEVGYVFNPDYQGHGYATEAVRALLPLAFDAMGLHRLVARVDARNAASAAVLRRIGMRREAHLIENEWFKGEWTDEVDFAMLASEWRTTQELTASRGHAKA